MRKIHFTVKPADQDKFALDSMRRFHHAWISIHEDEFFSPGNEHLRYRFMPFELIGWDAAKEYLPLIDQQDSKPTVEEARKRAKVAAKLPSFRQPYQITITEENVEKAYRRAQRSFSTENSITSVYAFYRFFQNLKSHGYDTSKAISVALQNDDDLVFQIAAQVLRHNKGIFCAEPREAPSSD